eukprot:709830-Hanusia_phi.AAC.1
MSGDGSARCLQASCGTTIFFVLLCMWIGNRNNEESPIATSSAALSSIGNKAGWPSQWNLGYQPAEQPQMQPERIRRENLNEMILSMQRLRQQNLPSLHFPKYAVQRMEFPVLRWKEKTDFSAIQHSDEMISKALNSRTRQIAAQQSIYKDMN